MLCPVGAELKPQRDRSWWSPGFKEYPRLAGDLRNHAVCDQEGSKSTKTANKLPECVSEKCTLEVVGHDVILIAPNTPASLYFGSVVLLGGSDECAAGSLGSQTFALRVAPEPASLLLLATGLVSLLGYGW